MLSKEQLVKTVSRIINNDDIKMACEQLIQISFYFDINTDMIVYLSNLTEMYPK